ncbi:MAG: glucose/sorbosone family PQQ-dependent dehydrogenase [Bacteroidota bacterium]
MRQLNLYSIFFLLCCASIPSFVFSQSNFTMSQIGPNRLLNTPWDLHYGPDDYLWVTERSRGSVVRINPETAERDQLVLIGDVYSTVGQDGLLGMALHPDFTEDQPYVYLSYTYQSSGRKQRIVRYTFSVNEVNPNNGSLSDPITLIENLPASNDHNSGRLIIGPDRKLYYSIGDQGGNQNSNFCNAVLSQILPSQAEIDQEDWSNYPGKILRINLDGSIPEDNPTLAGVRSHIFSYGHRNAQGIAFGTNGRLYSDEHGPDTDDEVNLIEGGMNYGWPIVAGYLDNQAYDYCNWSSVSNCLDLDYSKTSCPTGALFVEESTMVDTNYRDPIQSMFAVTDDYDFNNPICENSWLCRPNVAPSSIAVYDSDVIPDWQNSLLVTSLKRGRVYRLKLNEDGTKVLGDTIQHFYTQNRYRDIVAAPDGRSFYIITDQGGRTSDASGFNQRSTLLNPGAILKFTYGTAVSTTNLRKEELFQIWPNPASDQLNITLKKSGGPIFSADLISSTGEILRPNIPLQFGNNQLSTNDLPAGIYFLRLASKENSWLEKVVLY